MASLLSACTPRLLVPLSFTQCITTLHNYTSCSPFWKLLGLQTSASLLWKIRRNSNPRKLNRTFQSSRSTVADSYECSAEDDQTFSVELDRLDCARTSRFHTLLKLLFNGSGNTMWINDPPSLFVLLIKEKMHQIKLATFFVFLFLINHPRKLSGNRGIIYIRQTQRGTKALWFIRRDQISQ